ENDRYRNFEEIEFDIDYLPYGKSFKSPALFLDRDGILIEDTDYPGKIEDVIFKDDVLPVLRLFLEHGFKLIVVTNQSGIGRGFYTEEDFFETTKYIAQHFQKQNIEISQTYFCPFHENATVKKYKQASVYRKPLPGMVLRACHEQEIDLARSFM